MAMKRSSSRRGRERRGSERADAQLSMRVEAGATGASKIVTESQNISASGVYSYASHYLAPLSKVQLTIVLPRSPGADGSSQELVKCDGIVVRCDQKLGERSETPYELACMFTRLDATLRHRIEDFVTWRNLQALRAALAPAPRAGRRASGPSRATPPVRAAARKLAPARGAAPRASAKKKRAAAPARRKSTVRTAASARGAKKASRTSAGRTVGRTKR